MIYSFSQVESNFLIAGFAHVASLMMLPVWSGCYWCSLRVVDSKWTSVKMTASFNADVDQSSTRSVVVHESLSSAGRLLRPAVNLDYCLVLYAVWDDYTPLLTGDRLHCIALHTVLQSSAMHTGQRGVVSAENTKRKK